MSFIGTGALISFLSKLNFLIVPILTGRVGKFDVLVQRTRLWVVRDEKYKREEEEYQPHGIISGEKKLAIDCRRRSVKAPAVVKLY